MTKYSSQMLIDYGLTQMEFAVIVATAEDDARLAKGNCTRLAEFVAEDLGHEEWLGEETHPVWDIAVDVMQAYEAEVITP